MKNKKEFQCSFMNLKMAQGLDTCIFAHELIHWVQVGNDPKNALLKNLNALIALISIYFNHTDATSQKKKTCLVSGPKSQIWCPNARVIARPACQHSWVQYWVNYASVPTANVKITLQRKHN